MNYQEFAVDTQLRHYIDCYWTLRGYWSDRETIRILPDGCMDLLLNLGENIYGEPEELLAKHEEVYLIGTSLQPKEHFLHKEVDLLGIRFKPGGFTFFYPYESLHLFAGRVLEFEPAEFPDLKKIIQFFVPYLDSFFLERMVQPRFCIIPILSTIDQFQGNLKIDQLARHHSLSVRQMERHFKNQIGISPKEYINLTRFNFVLKQIQNNKQNRSLLDIAFEAGYYDHAHLTNEVKRYTGMTPSSFILSDFSKA